MIHLVASLWPWGSNNLGDWSNFLSPLEGIGAFSAGYVLYRKHNCHVKGCPRIGRHPVHGTPFITCQRHHPRDEAPTQALVLEAHNKHMAHVERLIAAEKRHEAKAAEAEDAAAQADAETAAGTS